MEKILNDDQNICLFCGNEKQQKWDDDESYYECDCEDAVKDRRIDKQIRELKLQRPTHKFGIVEKLVLYKK